MVSPRPHSGEVPGRRRSLAIAGVLVASLVGAPGLTASSETVYERYLAPELSPPPAPDMPLPGAVVARWSGRPTAFAPTRDGSVLLLDNEEKRVLEMRGERILRELRLRDGDFEPEISNLVDLVPLEDGGVAVLDAGAGTVWLTDPEGRVVDRRGHLVSATRLARAPDGTLLVLDPVSRAVVLLPPSGGAAVRHGSGHAPFPVAEGGLPFLRVDDEGVLVGLVPARGELPTPRTLTRLPPPAGMRILDARVVGATMNAVLVELLSAAPEDSAPRRTEVVRIEVADGASSRRTVPTFPNYCLDCGPTYRLGPDHALWAWAEAADGYEVIRLDPVERPVADTPEAQP